MKIPTIYSIKALLAAAVIASLAGCTSAQMTKVSAALTSTDATIAKYAPIVGKDILLVADILVQADCSPLVQTGTSFAVQTLHVVAANSTDANNVAKVLTTNTSIAAQLCPAYQAIKAEVGAVSGTPSQVVTVPAS